MHRTYRLIWEILSQQERKNFVFVLIITVIMAIFEVIGVAVILPFMKALAEPSIIETNGILNWFYQAFNFSSSQNFIVALGIFAFVVITISMAFRALASYILVRFSLMRSYAISSRLLKGYLYQPYIWFLSKNSAELGQTLLSEVDTIVRECILPAVMLIAHALVITMIVSLLFWVEPMVAIGAIVSLGSVYIVVYFLLRKLLKRIGQGRYSANKERFQVAQEATGGIKELKVMGLEEGYLKRFRDPALRMAQYQTLGLVIGRLPRFALEAVSFGGFILIAIVMLVQRGSGITDMLPLFALIGMAGTKLFPALQQMYQQISLVRFSLPALEKLHHNLTTLKMPVAPSENTPALHLTGRLDLENVRYRYPNTDQTTLDDFSMTIKAGSTVGIVGGTGAGKTTVIDLILGLLLPDEGKILIDGEELLADRIDAWQKSLGYVPQHIFLTDDTLAANIAFGVEHENIDMSAVKSAADVANLHEFVISDLQEGYDTIVGERGVRLSGGQRQRIGIARALYHNPDVLILDEATSALDNLTERAVMEAVHNLGESKTVIMIAHRLTTVKNCDTIFLLEQGKVVEQGSYDDLMKSNESFRNMVGVDGRR